MIKHRTVGKIVLLFGCEFGRRDKHFDAIVEPVWPVKSINLSTDSARRRSHGAAFQTYLGSICQWYSNLLPKNGLLPLIPSPIRHAEVMAPAIAIRYLSNRCCRVQGRPRSLEQYEPGLEHGRSMRRPKMVVLRGDVEFDPSSFSWDGSCS